MGLAPAGGWISTAEYEDGKVDRALESELQPGLDFSLMVALKPNKYQLQAYRRRAVINKLIPKALEIASDTTHVEEIIDDELEYGTGMLEVGKFAVVQFTLVHEAPAVDEKYDGTVEDGFWREASKRFTIGDINGDEAYFSFDTSGMIGDALQMLDAVELAGTLSH